MSREVVRVEGGSDVPGSSAEDLVSVIIPVYNSARFLAEAVDSVVGQTHARWELLLVDDGSSDASPAIARGYAERHPGQVLCLQHPGGGNRGTAATRNLGIQRAQGRYLAFLDSDDVWRPDKLRTQVALLRAHPEVAMTYGPSRWWYGWTGHPDDVARDFVQDLGVPAGVVVRPPALLALFLQNGKTVPIPASIMVRREVAQRHGGFEESFRGFPNGLYEDQTFFAKLALSEASLPAAEVHCWYRQHPGAVTALIQRGRPRAAARFTFLTWLDGYLSAQGAARSEVAAFVRKELWRRRHPRVARYLARARRVRARLQERLASLVNLLMP